jgi:hypothetical protein
LKADRAQALASTAAPHRPNRRAIGVEPKTMQGENMKSLIFVPARLARAVLDRLAAPSSGIRGVCQNLMVLLHQSSY